MIVERTPGRQRGGRPRMAGRKELGRRPARGHADSAMRETTVVNPEAAATGSTVDLPLTIETTDRARARRKSLVLAMALSVAAAVLATLLAKVLAQRSAVPTTGPRAAPTSTINVNWGLALFGANVIGEQRRRGTRIRDRLRRRR
jgi:hypothetical protein